MSILSDTVYGEFMLESTFSGSLRSCIGAQWVPRIGDPEITGWLTVLSYIVCFVLALRVSLRFRGRRGRGFWMIVTALLLFLGINKQLDLQTALTAAGRCLSHMQGWYEDRQTVQMLFIAAMIVVCSTAIALMLARMRGRVAENALAILGLLILTTFVTVRAVGFHHMDSLISAEIANVSFNFIFECLGIVLIGMNALWLLREAPPEEARQPA